MDMSDMHTILGAGGPVSNKLAEELASINQNVKLASRRQLLTRTNETWIKTDLLNPAEVLQAVKGSSVVYLTAGLQYDARVWQQQWPVVMRNVIDAVKESGSRLIFFDNVYCYGRVQGEMTETTPYHPSSVKGEVRARIASQLMEEVAAGNIRASIARAPDFYGATDSMNSFFDMMVLDKFAKFQKALWLGNPATLHAFIYVPDAAKGVFTLGQNPESDNQIWHLPTAKAITGHEFINLAAEIFQARPKFMKVNKLLLQILGLSNAAIKGTVEMYYQYQYDYVFSSSKFENTFSQSPVSYREGISQLFEAYYKAKRL